MADIALDPTFTDKLVEKWARYIASGTPAYLKRIAAIVLENQDHYMAGHPVGWQRAADLIGPGAREVVLESIVDALSDSFTRDVVSWQPALVGHGDAKIAYMRQRSAGPSTGMPEVSLEVVTDKIEHAADPAASIRTSADDAKHSFDAMSNGGGPDGRRTVLSVMLQEALWEAERKCIADLFKSAQSDRTIDLADIDKAFIDLNRVSNDIFHRSQRGPASRLLVSPQAAEVITWMLTFKPVNVIDAVAKASFGPRMIGTLADRWWVIVDPVLVPDDGLMIYTGPSLLDASAIFSPLNFAFNITGERDHNFVVAVMAAWKVVHPAFVSRFKFAGLPAPVVVDGK